MQTVPLSPKLADLPHPIERTEEAAIAGQIAVLLLEYRDAISAARSAAFLQKLAAIGNACPPALWVVLRLLSGDLAEITRSYSDIGKENSRSKQAAAQEMNRVLVVLNIHYPELAQALEHYRKNDSFRKSRGDQA